MTVMQREYCENRLSIRVHLQENVGGFLKMMYIVRVVQYNRNT